MWRLMAMAAVPAMLTGCQDSAIAGGDAAMAEPSPPSAIAAFQPGLYRVVQSGDVEIEQTRCFSIEQVAQQKFVGSDPNLSRWRIEEDRMSSGSIEVQGSGAADGRLVLKGTYDENGFKLDGDLSFVNDGKRHAISIRQQGSFLSPDCRPDDEITDDE